VWQLAALLLLLMHCVHWRDQPPLLLLLSQLLPAAAWQQHP
jgi:hypothetical protein